MWWLQPQRYTMTNTKDCEVGKFSVLGRNKDVFVTDMSFNSDSLSKTFQGCQNAIWILLQLLLLYTQDTKYHGSNMSHVHFQSKIHHATSTCPFIWDVLEHVACCRRVAPGNSNTPHVDGCMLLPHSNQTVTLMVVRFNMIFILKFIIPADHSDNSW